MQYVFVAVAAVVAAAVATICYTLVSTTAVEMAVVAICNEPT